MDGWVSHAICCCLLFFFLYVMYKGYISVRTYDTVTGMSGQEALPTGQQGRHLGGPAVLPVPPLHMSMWAPLLTSTQILLCPSLAPLSPH